LRTRFASGTGSARSAGFARGTHAALFATVALGTGLAFGAFLAVVARSPLFSRWPYLTAQATRPELTRKTGRAGGAIDTATAGNARQSAFAAKIGACVVGAAIRFACERLVFKRHVLDAAVEVSLIGVALLYEMSQSARVAIRPFLAMQADIGVRA